MTTDTRGRTPKRLIEVDLPIREISAHSRHEKAVRHGHISTLHIWWARRPLAACRAVILAALLPDPVDPLCPTQFRTGAATLLQGLRDLYGGAPKPLVDPLELRAALLAFIAQFSNWERSTATDYLDVSRKLVRLAHECMGGTRGGRPLVVDPFAGGGAIPLEALRVGGDAFASDLNPVAVLLNKVVVEYIPKHGLKLADEVRRWGDWIRTRALEDLGAFYPTRDGSAPLAYIWARTVSCEGPGCGVEVPLLRSLWLAKRAGRSTALSLTVDEQRTRINIGLLHDVKERDVGAGTIRRGTVTCPACGYTLKIAKVRAQLAARNGGARSARLLAVVATKATQAGRLYFLPSEADSHALHAAAAALEQQQERASYVPDEPTTQYHSFVNRGPIYGMKRWSDYYTPRQLLALSTIAKLIDTLPWTGEPDLGVAVKTCLALALDKLADLNNSLTRWKPDAECPVNLFGRQAIPFVWDFAEAAPLSDASGSWASMFERTAYALQSCGHDWALGTAAAASATKHPLPDDIANAVITDPPYYYSVQYADLSDFFYVWLKRTLSRIHPDLFHAQLTPKDEEVIVQSPGHEYAKEGKNNAFYENRMSLAMAEARRILSPAGIAVVVFAHKSTRGWEAQLQAMVNAGWIITASWPIDTEMASRVIAQGRAVLASSIHLVCRPREALDGRVDDAYVGDWRAVLAELPTRIREWMHRLAREGIVGADAIFACLGPALEIFSRYSRVEKVSGEQVLLREYLEQVWAAVAREALALMFSDADAAGLEEDARLTAIWLWTLAGPQPSPQEAASDATDDDIAADDEDSAASSPTSGFSLEYDAARKIAQGLGVHMEQLEHVVEISGSSARLLAVSERTRYLFGKSDETSATKKQAKKKQLTLFADLEESAAVQGWGEAGAPRAGTTTLDRVHQAMLLFASGRSDALKRFLVEEAAGRQAQFWKLAQSLSALYPSGSEEKRWVDGVLARKKGLGFG